MQFSKRKLLMFGVSMSTLIMVAYLYHLEIISPPERYIVLQKTHTNNISCHYIKTGDVLPTVEEVLNSSDKYIYFHETSCRGGINLRQACSIESAARAHPSWQINVLFSGPVTKLTLERTCLAKLKEFNNVRFARVYIDEYAKGTPLEILVNNGSLQQSPWGVEHTSDVLRYLTLYKWGGVYLDTDIIVVKPFDDLGGNWVGKQDDLLVNAAAIGISKDSIGRDFVNEIIEELSTTFLPDVWEQNGPGAVTRVLEKFCTTKKISDWSPDTCGFPVYGNEYFYPVPYEYNDLYFYKTELHFVRKVYTHHTWNKLTEDIQIQPGSVYDNLAKKYCPTIYNTFMKELGEK